MKVLWLGLWLLLRRGHLAHGRRIALSGELLLLLLLRVLALDVLVRLPLRVGLFLARRHLHKREWSRNVHLGGRVVARRG